MTQVMNTNQPNRNWLLDAISTILILVGPVLIYSFLDVFLIDGLLGKTPSSSILFHVAIAMLTMMIVAYTNFGGLIKFWRFANPIGSSIRTEVYSYYQYTLPILLLILILEQQEADFIPLSLLLIEKLESAHYILLDQFQLILLFPAGVCLVASKWLRPSLAIGTTVIIAGLIGLISSPIQLVLVISSCIAFAKGIRLGNLFLANVVLMLFLQPLMLKLIQ